MLTPEKNKDSCTHRLYHTFNSELSKRLVFQIAHKINDYNTMLAWISSKRKRELYWIYNNQKTRQTNLNLSAEVIGILLGPNRLSIFQATIGGPIQVLAVLVFNRKPTICFSNINRIWTKILMLGVPQYLTN